VSSASAQASVAGTVYARLPAMDIPAVSAMPFAIWTARRPVVPPAPFTKTVLPAANVARSVMAAHADMPGPRPVLSDMLPAAASEQRSKRGRRHRGDPCHQQTSGLSSPDL